MAGLKKPTAAEYHKIPWKTKVHYLGCWYLDGCTNDSLFVSGRPSKALNTFKGYLTHKVKPSDLQCLYEAVLSLQEKTILSVFDLWLLAEKVRVNQRISSGKPEESVEEYSSLLSYLDGL